MQTKTVIVKSGKAFRNGGRGYKAAVDADGTVRVWDDVAGHFTLCHNLTERQVAHVRRLAARA
jgi:hypothetical protein